jgi:hypothetical protein
MHRPGLFAVAAVLAAGMTLAVACGGSSSTATSPTTPTGSCTASSSPTTIVIQNGQLCPSTLTVTRGTQVTIMNSDSVVHEMDSDPHPEHTDCPELNEIDFLNTGQSRLSGNLNIARNCGFHDHMNPDNAAMKGTITIQ